MFRFIIMTLFVSGVMIAGAQAQELPQDMRARLTAGVTVFVTHPKDRPGPQDWNEGWFQNEGLFADASWPVVRLGDNTVIRAGVTGGAFDNSLHDTSVFLGGMAEIETHANERFTLGVGTYAGVITGYNTSPAPAIAPYVGGAYAINDKVELGMRQFWLPAETIAGADLAPSDAYVTALTIGTRF